MLMLDPTRRDDYEIITAMRGPDSGNEDLKALFTSVIRHYVMGTGQDSTVPHDVSWPFHYVIHGSLINTQSHARMIYGNRQVRAEYDAHFLHHMKNAFAALDRKLPSKNLRDYYNWAIEKLPFEEFRLDSLRLR